VLIVFVNASAARNEVEKTSRQIENGRYASELLSEDLRLAGFYGELSSFTLTALPTDPCSLTPSEWRDAMVFHLQGFDDTGFASANCSLTNLKANTDVLVVRRARACAAGIAGCDAAVNGKPYLQVALCASQIAPNNYKLGLEGTETFDRQKRNCLTTALANKREYMVRIYYIATDNGAGQNIPTLKRLELTGSGWSTVSLVEGIEEMQLHYGLDTNGDGQPDVYVADPNDHPVGTCSGACPRDNWTNVVTVEFHLLARNLEISPGYSEGTKKYILGKKKDGTNFERTPGDGYRRHVYSGLVRVANAAGRRDTP
jgi:type IV pilus assembly protein PilW